MQDSLRQLAPVVLSLLGCSSQTLSEGDLARLEPELRREGLLMASLEARVSSGRPVPEALKLELVKAMAWELQCRTRLERLGELAGLGGDRVVAFKGISLALSVYRCGQRSFGDLDVAPHRGKEEALLASLLEAGAVQLVPEMPEVSFEGVNIDIHSHPLGQLALALELPQERWLASAVPWPIGRSVVLVLAPEHEFLLALFHGSKHCFCRANWLVDAAMLAYHRDPAWLAAAVERHQAGRHLWLAQSCLKDWFGVELPEPLQCAVRQPPRWEIWSWWLRNRILTRNAPAFLGMLTPLWAIRSWRKRLAYLTRLIFPPGIGWKYRVAHLISLLRSA